MNFKLLGALFIIMLLGCSDEEKLQPQPEISFVREDGSELLETDCIDPDEKFLLLIRLLSANIGPFEPKQVDYTLNGELYSVTFTSEGSKLIPIELNAGENIVQAVSSGFESRINVASQGDFVLVE